MLRLLSSLVSLSVLLYGGYYISVKHPEIKSKIMDMVHSGNFHTLEARFSARQIMEGNKRHLLRDERHQFLEPTTKYSPYLLMEVKYTRPDLTTGEGILLWDLIDGEMVRTTTNWEKTHGYADCIKARLTPQEFRIVNLLADRGGTLDRGSLIRILQTENESLDRAIESCRKKKLIVLNGNQYRLHLQRPRLHVLPETTIDEHLVTKSLKNAERLSPRFSDWQIKQIAESAFSADFAIRSSMTVYLPIYSISVYNPDGTARTSYWNALSGNEIPFSALIE